MLKKRAVTWWLATAASAALVAGLAVGVVLPYQSHRRTNAQADQSATPLTIQQAWDVLTSAAKLWNKDAELIQLTSTNVTADTSDAGQDGRRISWQAIASTSDRQASVQLQSRGQSVNRHDQGSGMPGTKSLVRPQVDSPDAIHNALVSTPSLKGLTGKALGYHFVLKAGPPSVITVLGSLSSTPATVDIDAQSGSAAVASTYTADASGGILYSADGGRTWQASNLAGLTVRGVAVDPQQPRSAWAVTQNQTTVSVYQSTDGGRSWAHTGDLPSSTMLPAFAIIAGTDAGGTTLAVGTTDGVWLSNDGAKTWTRATGLPAGPAQFLAFTALPTGLALDVSISAGPNAGHYRSTDQRAFVRVGNAGRLSTVDDRNSIVSVDEPAVPSPGSAVAATVRRASMSAPLTLPANALRLAGETAPGSVLLAEGSDGIHRSTDGGKSWQKVLDGSLASLTQAPSFARSGISVAGGFRTGIYRTADSGQTWTNVLPNPANVLPGNNEISSVAFTSDSDVIAVQGSPSSWKPMAK